MFSNHFGQLFIDRFNTHLMIQAKGIEKSFGENQVLKGINVDFIQGQTNLIIGRSGSGKTVLLKLSLIHI